MNIRIAKQKHPFSHLPGVVCPLPQSSWCVQVFPTLAVLKHLEGKDTDIHIPFAWEGPVKEFTVRLNVDKGAVEVFGKAKQGYFSYQIVRLKEGIILEWKKTPIPSSRKMFAISDFFEEKAPCLEVLSLGVHKTPDWDLVKRRLDFKEIFPVWLKLAHHFPKKSEEALELLEACRQASRKDILDHFTSLFLAGFSGVLTPRLEDLDFHGVMKRAASSHSSPSVLLTKGAELIRSLFVCMEGDTLYILPKLPSEFPAGRFIHVACMPGVEMDLEWSKHLARRLVLRSFCTQHLKVRFQKEIRTFRLSRSRKDRGEILPVDTPLKLEAHAEIYLDCFQK